MRFAVVDIETTGGFPAQHGITEIAIVLMDGKEIEGIYSTLVNPHQPYPFTRQYDGHFGCDGGRGSLLRNRGG